jgi:phosphoribosylaminoimidazolecarboxamide formyltransferase/IMP cyclohydrolase
MTIKRALISVYDKTGIVDFASRLAEMGIEIIATEGTLNVLRKKGIASIEPVSAITGFPEILGGRVKTEHPLLIGGILALQEKREHLLEVEKLGIRTIDMVICNLHPFKESGDQEFDVKSVVNHIDIGGPNLIRAAAKNYSNVVVIINPKEYHGILQELLKNGDVSKKKRFHLAVKAFLETATYDLRLYNFLKAHTANNNVQQPTT